MSTQYEGAISRGRQGLMLVLIAPSGAGKTSLGRALVEREEDLLFSVSMTTRDPRLNEENGRDYTFVSMETFRKAIHEGQFLEHTEVYGNCYGTPAKPVADQLSKGKDVLLDIDSHGMINILRKYPQHAVLVSILPPSMEELERRLRLRESGECVTRRLQEGRREITYWKDSNYVLINDEFEKTVQQLQIILHAERLRRQRQQFALERFISSFLGKELRVSG